MDPITLQYGELNTLVPMGGVAEASLSSLLTMDSNAN